MTQFIPPNPPIRQNPTSPPQKPAAIPAWDPRISDEFAALLSIPISELLITFEAFHKDKKEVFRLLAKKLSETLQLQLGTEGNSQEIAKAISTAITPALTLILQTSERETRDQTPPTVRLSVTEVDFSRPEKLLALDQDLEKANRPFPLLGILATLITKNAETTLIKHLTSACQQHLKHGQATPQTPWDGRLATFKIIGQLENISTTLLYQEGSALCRNLIKRVSKNHSVFLFLKDLGVAYDSQNLGEIKKVMAKLKE